MACARGHQFNPFLIKVVIRSRPILLNIIEIIFVLFCKDIKLHGKSKKDWKVQTILAKISNKKLSCIIKEDGLE